jgi:hypothetical protein
MAKKPTATPAAPDRPPYVDDPSVGEVFVDSLERIHVDGQIIRMEFSVMRWDEAGKPGSRTACRVVLPAKGAVDLLNRMNQLQAVLVQAGAVRRVDASTAN